MGAHLVQGSPEWLEMRKNYIGASDAPIIMGVSPWKTAYQLWEEKLGLREPPQMNSAMMKGHEHEPIALEAYNKHTGNEAVPCVVFHKEHKYMMASLDGLSKNGSVIVEIKCPGKKDHDIAAQGKVPEKYYPQLQHQLATMSVNLVHYFSYKDDDFHIVEVKRDEDYIDEMIRKEGEFWNKVVNWEAPDLDEKDYVQRQDEEWKKQSLLWRDAKESLKHWKDVEDEARKGLVALSDGKCSIGEGVRLTKIRRKGAVDYGKIPELKNIDLDQYRKGSYETWRLT